jgi:Kef-type K+ transport system membrane component KefB
MSSFELSVHFFLQLASILTVCRVVGWLARWVGQSPVVAEMIAGVAIGGGAVYANWDTMASPIFEWVYRRPLSTVPPLTDASALSTP